MANISLGAYSNDNLKSMFPELFQAVYPYVQSAVQNLRSNPNTYMSDQYLDQLAQSIVAMADADNYDQTDDDYGEIYQQDIVPVSAQPYRFDRRRRPRHRHNHWDFDSRDFVRLLLLRELFG